MRAYFTTTVARAEEIWQDGWKDLYTEFGMHGVYLATQPLDARDGFIGEVTLCLDVPDELFDRHDLTDEIQAESGYRLSLIPGDELNKSGKPQVYDHFYAGASRRELLQAIHRWETEANQNQEVADAEAWKGEKTTHGNAADAQLRKVQEMRRAFEFFDRIGWLTPLRLREEAATNS